MSFLGIRTSMPKKTQATWAIAITIGIIFLTLAFLRTHQRQEFGTQNSPNTSISSSKSEGIKIDIDKTQSPPVQIEKK